MCVPSTNTTENVTSTVPQERNVEVWYFFFGLVGVLTVLGNSITIAIFIRFKNIERKRLYYVLINLAVTDLGVGGICVPLQIFEYTTKLTKEEETVIYILDVLFAVASMYSIALVSLERLLAVCWPLIHKQLRPWHYALAISLSWLVPGMVALVSARHLAKDINRLDGLNTRTVFVAMPIVVTIAAYCFLCMIRRGRAQNSRDEKVNRKLTQTLLIVTVIFFFTWSPFLIFVSTIVYLNLAKQCYSISRNTYNFITYLTRLLQYSNSCFNPFIYTLRIRRFRKAVREILSCKTRTGQETLSRSSSGGRTEMRYVSDITRNAKDEEGISNTKVATADKEL